MRQAQQDAVEFESAAQSEAAAASASPLSVTVLGLQRGYGNAAVARMLQRKTPTKPPPPPADMLVRGVGTAFVAGDEPAPVYAQPNSGKAAGELAPWTAVTLLATAGEFYAVEIGGEKRYVKQSDVGTYLDMPGDQSYAEWDERFRAMAKKMDEAGHTQGAPLRGTGTAKVDTVSGAFSAEFMRL